MIVPTAESTVAPPATSAPPRRRVPFDLLFDVRDLGGYRGVDGRAVRWRTLYRADALGRVAGHQPDIDRIAALGLRSVVDLRTDGEVAEHGVLPVEALGGDLAVEHFHHPVLSATWAERGLGPRGAGVDAVADFLAERYVDMLDEGAGAIGSVLALLSEPDLLPLALHGTVGKDRTGVVVAVVLSLLGVDDAVIAHDYGLSRIAMAELASWRAVTSPDGHRRLLAHPAAHLEAPPSAIRRLLSELRARWGSVEGYADSVYVDGAAVARLRRNLLAPR